MREIRLHDTRSGDLVALAPDAAGAVGIYACGPTVYGRIHIGNARPFVIFMLLKRFLEREGHAVTLVMNITDVNDKIYDAARAQGVGSAELALEMTERYRADTDALALGRPDHEPLASEAMPAIIAYIEELVRSGHAYAADGDVYFAVRSDIGYGGLSHRRVDDMDQGEGLEGAERKRDPLDFALWKATKQGEDTAWDSPWGPGRPGWHIECSAMAEDVLGVGFDIHGGGSDLVFPHHENEAAQTRAARGHELARLWMHNGMIQTTGEKMAKSVGNIAPLHEVIERYGAAAVVMYLISGHYRQPLAFSAAELEGAERRVYRVRDALGRIAPGQASPPDMAAHRDAFLDALANDFNTAKALGCMFAWIKQANRRASLVGDADLREMLSLLGLGELEPLGAVADVAAVDPAAEELRRERDLARAARDFARADELRERLRELGWEVRDAAAGSELLPLADA
ncbi:MAG TPA: cysteine--tRNA ligase [Solirubrobacteraceae bacterium]|nr:cysteine--tRNA ligase [Solirubrobacteraceae bacterium]